MKENDRRTYLDEVVSKSLSEEMIFKERNKKNEKEPALLHLERRAFKTEGTTNTKPKPVCYCIMEQTEGQCG